MVRHQYSESFASTDIREYASVYSEDLGDEDYGNYYAKFKETDLRGDDDASYDSDENSYEERQDEEDLSAADSFDSVETPSVEESYVEEVVEEKPIARNRKPARKKNARLLTPEMPSLLSVATPSVLDNEDRMMEFSDLGTVVDSVMSSLIEGKGGFSNKRNAIAKQISRDQMHYEDPPVGYKGQYGNEESSYDNFMNDFKNKSSNIVRKKSVGLAKLQTQRTSDAHKNGVRKTVNQVPNKSRPIQPAQRRGKNEVRRDGTQALKVKNTTRAPAPKISPPTVFHSPSNKTQNEQSVSSGLFNLRRTTRPPKPVPSIKRQAKAKNQISFEAKGSIEFGTDMSQPPVDLGGPAPVMILAEENEQILNLRKKANFLLARRQYNDLIPFLQANPGLIKIQYQQSNSRNLIHLIAIQQDPVPENVLLKIISEDPTLVAASDKNGNTPLHYASLNAKKGNMHVFLVMLKFHPLGVMQRNNEGDLPLHLAAANPNRGAQMAVHMLLETNSRALSEPNKKGKIPLHLALTVGSANLKSLKTMVIVHKARKYSFVVKDNRGNTPLHTAIMSGTSYQAIELFNRVVRETELSAYTKENDQRYLPLHLALMMKKVNPLVVLSLIKAAPFTAGIPTPSGDMPIHLATKAELKPEIIKSLLAADMPIEIGTKAGNMSMGTIVHREHGHSWWHVAVDKRSKYVDVVTSLLVDFATYVQIVALARSVGPNKKTITIDAAAPPLVDAFKNLLRFFYRYEISTLKLPLCTNENQSFPAFDHGEDLERLKVTGPWLKKGFAKIRENSRQTVANERSREILFVPWEPDEREIMLRCYTIEEHFIAEKSIRDQRNISSDYVESIVSMHNDSNYVNTSFTTGKIMCISFERNNGTLGEVISSNINIRNQAGWLSNCQTVLKDFATCLHHLHDNGLTHGRLDMIAFGKFGRGWKLLNIGNSTAMGNAMGGVLRKCAPPETLSGVQPLLPAPAIASQNGRSKSKARTNRASSSSTKGTSIGSSIFTKKKLPPLSVKGKSERKKFGVFIFGIRDLGLGNYGANKANSRKHGNAEDDSSLGFDSIDSSIASMQEGKSTASDEASARVIAMQEDEISRLRKALEAKEHIYRRQLAQERATFKKQEADRQRQLQKKLANENAKTQLPRYAPEKVMASASWDVWSLGLIMVEAIIGKSPLLPSSANTDEEFLERLSLFDETHLAAIFEEVGEFAGQYAADLVARLLHPKPQQRIASMDKVLQHKYFHEEVIEPRSKGSKVKKLPVGTSRKTRQRSRSKHRKENE